MTRVHFTDAFSLMPGESASSFVLRLANFLTVKPDRFLKSALGDARNLAWAVHRHDRAEFLSDASGLDPDVLALAFARHAGGLANERAVLEFNVLEHHLDQTIRRVSPMALARDLEASIPPYHRILWSLCDLNRDPETGSPLISACDRCGRTLTWENCVDPGCCGRCGRQLWRAKTSEEPMTRFDQFVCDLFHPNPIVRSERRARLAPPLAGWSEGDLLDLMHTLHRLQRLFPAMPQSAEPVEPHVIEAGSSIKELMELPIRTAARASPSTAVTVVAAAITAVLRAAPPQVAGFLQNLLMSRS
jgi:TniQ